MSKNSEKNLEKTTTFPELGRSIPAGVVADAAVDSVTGLPSSVIFQQDVASMIQAIKDGSIQEKWDVLCFDIRKFKNFNQMYGFSAGNELLHNLGSVIRDVIGTDNVTRISADHFYVLIEDERAEEAGRLIHEKMNDNGRDSVSVCMGIYTLTGQEAEVGLALDRAMSAADQSHDDYRVWYRRFEKQMEEKMQMEAYIISHVQEAVDKGWIRVYYQPVVGTLSDKISSMEALSRWIDPKYGFLSPASFIPVLENYRIVYLVDLYVLECVCRDIRHAIHAELPVPSVSVNLSRHDLEVPDLHERINDIISKYKIPHSLIHFEITESALIAKEELVYRHIEQFHKEGFEIWLDDFGSGYSSLNTLQNYDFDCVKIDMYFLRSQNRRTPQMMRSIVDLSKRIGMLTLTEGVETKEQLDFLKSIGCSLAQGYYFSKPVPVEEILKNPKLMDMGVETNREKTFYRKVGQINILNSSNPLSGQDDESGIPTAILGLMDDRYRFLYTNKKIRPILTQALNLTDDQLYGIKRIEDNTTENSAKNLLGKAERSGKPESYDFFQNGLTGRLEARFITEYMGRKAFYIRILDLEKFSGKKEDRFARLQDLYTLFSEVSEIDTTRDRYIHIYGEMDAEGITDWMTIHEVGRYWAKTFVHPDDQERFLAFTDGDTIEERLAATPAGIINTFFYIRNTSGAYEWRRMVISRLGMIEGNMRYLIAVGRNLVGWTPASIEKLTREGRLPDDMAGVKESDDILHEQSLWEALTTQEKLGVFWKDKRRRFVGANAAFLRYYHLTPGDIIGRNDEDMGWHPDPEAFKRDEERVLTEGAVVTEAVTECIVDGKVRKIMASKVPVYEHGKIAGLVGYFVDITNAEKLVSLYNNNAATDSLTGLLNINGIQAAGALAEQNYEAEGRDFAISMISVSNFQSFERSFGHLRSMELVRMIGEAIRQAVPEESMIGHTYGGRFTVQYYCKGQNDVWEQEQKIVEAISAIRRLDEETPVSLYCGIGSARYSDYHDMEEMMAEADRRLNQER